MNWRILPIVSLCWALVSSTVSSTVAPPPPTAVPTPVITSRNDSCEAAIAQLLKLDFEFQRAQLASCTGCVLFDHGWIWPDSSSSAATAEITPEEAEAIRHARAEFYSELRIFTISLSQQISPFAVGGQETMLDSIRSFTSYACSYGSGLSGFNRGAPGEYTVVETYTTYFVFSVGMANSPWLTTFTSWWLSDRWSARPTDVDKMNPLARQGFDNAMYWARAPWPYEMNARHIQDRFFRFMIDTGRIPF